MPAVCLLGTVYVLGGHNGLQATKVGAGLSQTDADHLDSLSLNMMP